MDPDYSDELVPEPTFKQREAADAAGRVLIELEGELDMLVGPSLAARFHELAEDGTHDVVVDLTDARFIDTTILETFVAAQHELEQRDHKLAVVAAQPYARRTFELTGLEQTLRVSGSRDEALARLAH
jgi:anti-sigma B factor antagonist